MTARHRLNGEERRFFGLVARAAFTNPFSDERQDVDRTIGGADAEPGEHQIIQRVLTEIQRRIEDLDARGRADPRRYPDEDAQLLRASFLFHIFHRYLDAFDRLIEQQAARGDSPCPVPFAAAALADLSRRGFSDQEAVRYVGLFYQLRRAYYLIYRNLVGRSPSMARLRLHLWQNVFTADVRWYERRLWQRMEDFSTLMLGETGTGKGAAAAALGKSGFIPFDPESRRFTCSFTHTLISINLSQFSEALLESELFGHRKGAFTGAIDNHQGMLARCSPHGAIFLDEIGDVSLPAQIKLLKVLEERMFSPVGGHDALRFEGRIIAATHHDVQQLRRDGRFRDDFYYRLCSDCIHVPTLRERLAEEPRELDEMIRYLIGRMVGEAEPELTDRVAAAIRETPGPDYAWPGNVRELEQAVRRILLTGTYAGESPAGADLRRRLRQGIDRGDLTAHDLVRDYCALLYGRHRNYVEVARRTGLDRRTVKKHVEQAGEPGSQH